MRIDMNQQRSFPKPLLHIMKSKVQKQLSNSRSRFTSKPPSQNQKNEMIADNNNPKTNEPPVEYLIPPFSAGNTIAGENVDEAWLV